MMMILISTSIFVVTSSSFSASTCAARIYFNFTSARLIHLNDIVELVGDFNDGLVEHTLGHFLPLRWIAFSRRLFGPYGQWTRKEFYGTA